MSKTILITGSTDGIGLETATLLAAAGHKVLLHGRSDAKLADAQNKVSQVGNAAFVETYKADLSNLAEVETLAATITENHQQIDVLINNAGVFKVSNRLTEQGIDMRFMVNTIAPYLLTQQLLPLLPAGGRVINLSSAAQMSVNLEALAGKVDLDDGQAYAQSKLAITMWSFHLAQLFKQVAIIAVNPASFLGSKMVKEAYGVAGHDLRVGADILVKAALSEEFAQASGKYFDNDQRRFAAPHCDALDAHKNAQLVQAIEAMLKKD